jgi:SNF2 family DNA or RNA helicase
MLYSKTETITALSNIEKITVKTVGKDTENKCFYVVAEDGREFLVFYNVESANDYASRLYAEMELTFLATLPEGDEVLAPNQLVQMIRLKQFASNPLLVGSAYNSNKWDAVSELLEYEQLPALIWTSFKATAHYLTTELQKKYRVKALTGDTPEAERQMTVQQFQNGHLDIIVAHPGVGKYGLTLTAAHTAIYLERGYGADDYYQSLHRVRRIGTTQSPHVIHLLSGRPNGNKKGTIDHVIDRVLAYRKDSAIALTSGEIRRLFNE